MTTSEVSVVIQKLTGLAVVMMKMTDSKHTQFTGAYVKYIVKVTNINMHFACTVCFIVLIDPLQEDLVHALG